MKTIALVGASGVVGRCFEELFRESDLCAQGWELLKVARRARPDENIYPIEDSRSQLAEARYIVNASESHVAKELFKNLTSGQVLIDNSSAFRMDSGVPLVVPEINASKIRGSQVVANPNCTTILLTLCLKALSPWGVKRVFVSTYQAASGAGIAGLNELKDQWGQLAQAGEVKSSTSNSGSNSGPSSGDSSEYPVFGYPLANNVISHNSDLEAENSPFAFYNGEERKVMEESRKILENNDLAISATCMRVPVERAHLEAVQVDLGGEASFDEIQKSFQDQSGLKWCNDLETNCFPMPILASGKKEVFVGRLRKDPSTPNSWSFILAGDQLLKGAAWNAFQILEHSIRETH